LAQQIDAARAEIMKSVQWINESAALVRQQNASALDGKH
jgi:hypothetical protein